MRYQHDVLRLVCGDETTAIAAAGTVHASHMPYPMTVTGVRASLTTGPTTGTMLVDIEEEGESILAAPIELAAGETSSAVASNLPFIVDDVLGDAALITVVVTDEASGDAAGLKVDIIGHRWIIPFTHPYGLSGASGEGVGLPVVPLPPPPVTVTINQGSGQSDPTSGSSIVFDVVFSSDVAGFATGDVTLTGTAGGTLVGTVAGSGDTYTVTVTGMTTDGTVIASIPAGVATSVATGAANAASTSTDNTVDWETAFPAANLWMHFDATVGVTASGGAVSQWDDQSGNGRHAVQATAANKPTTGTRTANGLNVIDFDGSDWLHRTAAIGFPTGNYSLYIVCGSDADSSNFLRFLSFHNGGSDFDTADGFCSTQGNASNRFAHFQISNLVESGASSGATQFGTWSVRKGTGSQEWEVMTPAGGTNLATNASSGTANGGFVIGAGFESGVIGTNAFNGPIAEILLYTGLHVDADRDAVRAYLIAKWGA